ncbi:hypothetical protein HPB52_022855 [Rhipicephalus sanguineus]|uniref:Uncharacterized protein n=1 Tax=Rhipicephalus sanguineus TaxID=34632 RepID=A0A9D4YQT6_RHISA|nr:hypothetical protein HPB52_022855 [Rhipicephalus sanguineus]
MPGGVGNVADAQNRYGSSDRGAPSCVLGRLPLFPSLVGPTSLGDQTAGRGVYRSPTRDAHNSPTLLLSPVVPLTCGAGSLTPGDPGDSGLRRLTSSAVPTDSPYMPKKCAAFTADDVRQALKNLALGLAPGPDGLTSGFSADRAAQKAFDSVRHAALLPSLQEGGGHEDCIMAITDMYWSQSTVYSFRGQSDAGGLGFLELSRVSAEVQVKGYARLQRFGSPIVYAVLEGALDGFRRELEAKMGVPSGVVEASSLNKALREARLTYFEDSRRKYTNKSLSFENNPVGNRWLWPDARFMSDGDRIKALRLRTNLFPSRTLSNRHSKDDSARLCIRCH